MTTGSVSSSRQWSFCRTTSVVCLLSLSVWSAMVSTSTAFSSPASTRASRRTRMYPSRLYVVSDEIRSFPTGEDSESWEKGEDEKKKKFYKKNDPRVSRQHLKSSDASPPPDSPLNSLMNEEEAFEIHVGRALDAIRRDYPRILVEQPDLTIFDKKVEVIDPSGVKLVGLYNYKTAFRFMHGIVNLFYCPDKSLMTFRMCYDSARQNIRVHWNAEIVPKKLFGGVRQTLHADGISVYEITRKNGLITQHRIERLLINDVPLQPQQGIFALLRNEHDECVPVFSSGGSLAAAGSSTPSSDGLSGFDHPPACVMEFNPLDDRTTTSLWTAADSSSSSDVAVVQQHDQPADTPGLDLDAYDRKNASRKKFGLEPLSPEEFLEIETRVKQMESQQRTAAASAAVTETSKPRKSFFQQLFGGVVGEDTCESNFDCRRPEVCCDLGIKKICCSAGAFVGRGTLEPALVPIPQGIDDPYPRTNDRL